MVAEPRKDAPSRKRDCWRQRPAIIAAGPLVVPGRSPGERDSDPPRRRDQGLLRPRRRAGPLPVDPARLRLRPARPQRRGQDHHPAHDHEHPGPRLGARSRSSARPADQAARDRIGYMPEERGLYPRMVRRGAARCSSPSSRACRARKRRAGCRAWLERLGLADWRKRKLNELSKGMQQKAQFIATVLHEPEVLILDEPHERPRPRRRRPHARRARSSCAARARRSCSRATRWRRSSGSATRSRSSTAGEKVLEGAVSEVKSRHGKNTLVLAYEGDGAFLAGAARRAQGQRLRPLRRGADGGRAPTRRRSCARRPRGCASAASRWSSRACTTSSWSG